MDKAGPSFSIPTKLLATGVACALALVVCGTAATVVMATDVARNQPIYEDLSTVESVATIHAFRDQGLVQALFDSLLAPLGAPTKARPDDITLMTALGATGRSASKIWDVADGMTPWIAPIPVAHWVEPSNLFDSLSQADRALMMLDTLTPWLPIFRRWARAQPLPALWSYRAGLPGATEIRTTTSRNFSGLRAMFTINENAAMIAAQDGRSNIARQRLLENLSASRHFIEQPVLMDAIMGRRFAQRSAQLLAQLSSRTGDTLTATRARALDSASAHVEAFRLVFSLSKPETDAHSHVVQNAAANRALPPSVRVEVLNAIIKGACRNTPEIVFGFSSARRAALLASIGNLNDLDRGAELATGYVRMFDQMESESSMANRPNVVDSRHSQFMDAISWIVPPGVRARAAYCGHALF